MSWSLSKEMMETPIMVAMKSFGLFGRESETIKKLPIKDIVGKKYGNKLAKWWLPISHNDMNKFKGGELVLYRPSQKSDWIYACYVGQRHSVGEEGTLGAGIEDTDYLFQTSPTYSDRITFTYTPEEAHKRIPGYSTLGKSWSSGEIAVFDSKQWEKDHPRKT